MATSAGSDSGRFKLRLGQPVHTSDGLFGELADIVVDPIARTVTHLIVQPHHQHRQARLVPVWLTEAGDEIVTVHLGTRHLRQLQQVAFTDFIDVAHPIDLGEQWDVGTERIVSLPYMNLDFELDAMLTPIQIEYDRIPKDECEIRRTSSVITSDGYEVGQVEGFVAEGEDSLVAVIVRSGPPWLKHVVGVPMAAVKRVLTDRVELSIDRHAYRQLPRSDEGPGPTPAGMGRRIGSTWGGFVDEVPRRSPMGSTDSSVARGRLSSTVRWRGQEIQVVDDHARHPPALEPLDVLAGVDRPREQQPSLEEPGDDRLGQQPAMDDRAVQTSA